MPHVGGANAEDLASSDEIKVFEDEGEDDREKRASADADLTDLKSSLITEGDQEKSSQVFSSKSSSQQQSTSHHQNGQRAESISNFGKAFEPLGYPAFGYPLPHSPYHPNGTLGQMANKMAAAAAAVGAPHSGSPLPFIMPNMEGFPQPPPAHMGISPVMRCETKANISMWMDIDLTGIARNPLYNLSGHGQYSHSVLSDFTQQLQWNPAMYQLQQAAFRGPYPHLPPVTSAAFPSFGRTPLMPHPSLSGHSFPHPSFLPSATSSNASANSNLSNGLSNGSKSASRNGTTSNGSNLLSNGLNVECRIKQEHSPQPAGSNSRQMSANSPSANSHDSSNNNNPSISNKNRGNSEFSDSNSSSKLSKHSPNSRSQSSNGSDRESHNSKLAHVKKPLNAFMIYMKEMRAKVIAESTLKESAAINQILGKRWHNLTRIEQEKYYEKAKKERELHMSMHPGWTAKDNYAINAKRKKKKRERNADGERGALKKCRARYGLDQQNHWCKPCRRKKKCIRYMEAARAAQGDNRNDDDNLGSVGSVEAPTPESKSTNESDHDNPNSTDLSLSSPSSDYHHFMSTFNPFSSAPSLTPQTNHLHLNGHTNGHLPSPSLFYPHHNSSSSSLNSPIGSRMSSLLTPNSPLTSLSNFSSCSPLAPPIQAPVTPSPSHVPPRNSPFSIEQLARPHCPQNRSSPSSSKLLNSTSHHSKSNGSVTVSVITQLPTPPSSTDSTSATPTMLSVA